MSWHVLHLGLQIQKRVKLQFLDNLRWLLLLDESLHLLDHFLIFLVQGVGLGLLDLLLLDLLLLLHESLGLLLELALQQR